MHTHKLTHFIAYPETHPLYCKDNCAAIFKMKVESNGVPISEFVALKPKMYDYKTDKLCLGIDYKDDKIHIDMFLKEDKKAKGVVKYVVNKGLCFDTYTIVLDSGIIIRREQNIIRSIKHQLYTIKQNKIALSAVDTQRWINDDGVSSYAHGHYAITMQKSL